MAVLFAVEMFVNITIRLRCDVIQVWNVMTTARMAIARTEVNLPRLN
jgi:hypothetical protein